MGVALSARPRTPPRGARGARPPPQMKTLASQRQAGMLGRKQSSYQLGSARPQSPAPPQAASGDTVTRTQAPDSGRTKPPSW